MKCLWVAYSVAPRKGFWNRITTVIAENEQDAREQVRETLKMNPSRAIYLDHWQSDGERVLPQELYEARRTSWRKIEFKTVTSAAVQITVWHDERKPREWYSWSVSPEYANELAQRWRDAGDLVEFVEFKPLKEIVK